MDITVTPVTTINHVGIGQRESDFAFKSVPEVSLTKSENANRSRQPPRENIKRGVVLEVEQAVDRSRQ